MEFLKQQFHNSSADPVINHYQTRDLLSPASSTSHTSHKSSTQSSYEAAEDINTNTLAARDLIFVPEANTHSPNAEEALAHLTKYHLKGAYMSQSDISDQRQQQQGQNTNQSNQQQQHQMSSQMAPVSQNHHQHQMSQLHLHSHHGSHQSYSSMSQQQHQNFLLHSQQMGYTNSNANENERENSVEDEDEEEDNESNNNSSNEHFSKEYSSLASYSRVLGNGAHHALGQYPTDMQSYNPEDLINSGIQQPSNDTQNTWNKTNKFKSLYKMMDRDFTPRF